MGEYVDAMFGAALAFTVAGIMSLVIAVIVGVLIDVGIGFIVSMISFIVLTVYFMRKYKQKPEKKV